MVATIRQRFEITSKGINGFDFKAGDASGTPNEIRVNDSAAQTPNLTFGANPKDGDGNKHWSYFRFATTSGIPVLISGTPTVSGWDDPTVGGLGIPASGTVILASVFMKPKETDTAEFAADVSLLAVNNGWEQDLEKDWSPATNVGMGLTISGNGDTDHLWETYSTANLSNWEVKAADPENVAVSQSFVPTVTGFISSALVSLQRTATLEEDVDVFLKIFTNISGTPISHIVTSDAVSFNSINGLFTFPATGTALLHAGTRYHAVLEGTWPVKDALRVFVRGDNPQPNETFNIDGPRSAFSQANYPRIKDLPAPFENDNTTEKVPPFGSIIEVEVPAFTSTSSHVNLGDISEIIQEWVDDGDYNPELPVGVVWGPGDAIAGEQKRVKATSSTNTNDSAFLDIFYEVP